MPPKTPLNPWSQHNRCSDSFKVVKEIHPEAKEYLRLWIAEEIPMISDCEREDEQRSWILQQIDRCRNPLKLYGEIVPMWMGSTHWREWLSIFFIPDRIPDTL